MNPSPTPSQQAAIVANGNVLVVAGAGAGKTRTLVERCLARVLDPKEPVSIDQILMVTFTEAAAAEMRKRLREGLEEARRRESSPHLEEQIALLDTAPISTLHSFCFRLVRQHFYELGLDPRLIILPDEEARLLAREAMDHVFELNYRGATEDARAVQALITEQGRDWDQPVRDLVERIHAYTQTLPDPEGWFAEQEALFRQPEPTRWQEWLHQELGRWRELWRSTLRPLSSNSNAQKAADVLDPLTGSSLRSTWADALAQIAGIDQDWPPKKKTVLRQPMEDFFDEAAVLRSFCAPGQADPLEEDWRWVCPPMLALLDLARQFALAYAQAKRHAGGLDFHDLEQFALRLLWKGGTGDPPVPVGDPPTGTAITPQLKQSGLEKKAARDLPSGQWPDGTGESPVLPATFGGPTDIARQWRRKLKLLFVDEFQDINAAQETIIRALAGEGPAANRFLVGDIKQSIYRFRLADPRIFAKCHESWQDLSRSADFQPASQPAIKPAATDSGQVLSLADNFRSHEGILQFVNAAFSVLMRRELGGLDYDDEAHLHFGAPEQRAAFRRDSSQPPPVELHLCRSRRSNTGNDEAALSATETEARFAARRLLELKTSGTMVWEKGRQRPLRWSDLVILLRSPRGKVESYVKEFARLGVPLTALRGGFYESQEIADLLSLLQILDNPQQDIPLLTVLHSPLAGLSAADLAVIRTAHPKGRFWHALVQAGGDPPSSALFLTRHRRWRRLARRMPVSHCLEMALAETGYADWLLTQDRGEQRRANVERLLQLARQFDTFQGQGLYRFLKFVEAQQEGEIDLEPAALPTADAVRLMSIHQSKGLEFPVVVLADLGKRFNFGDALGRVILDQELGLCPKVKPPSTPQFYPSLPWWLASHRQRRETLGEELRLLYVATTRAIERLILIGTTSDKGLEERWPSLAARHCAPAALAGCTNYLDWLGGWLSMQNGGDAVGSSGQGPHLTWTIHDQEEADDRLKPELQPATVTSSIAAREPAELSKRLAWSYPFQAATTLPAKTSVSALRHAMQEEDENSTRPFDHPAAGFQASAGRPSPGKLNATQVGLAHHHFLELVSLDRVGSHAELKSESMRLREAGVLTEEERNALDLPALLAFWQSPVARELQAQRDQLRREFPFTARFSFTDFQRLGSGSSSFSWSALPDDTGEFVVVQGVVDLAVILPTEIWLLDFKTDQFPEAELPQHLDRYRPQLALYADALSRIYGKPVTKCWLHFLHRQQTVSLL